MLVQGFESLRNEFHSAILRMEASVQEHIREDDRRFEAVTERFDTINKATADRFERIAENLDRLSKWKVWVFGVSAGVGMIVAVAGFVARLFIK